ncbi:MAG: helix-turn-helix transcriptional regulator [Polyangiaceae bacterium]
MSLKNTSEHMGDRIRALRKERGWTLDQLADASGLTKGFLSQAENGKTQLTGPVLLRVARALGASVDYLLRGHEAEAPVAETRSVEVPPELAELAEEQRWSAKHVFALVRAQAGVLARRSDRPRRISFSKAEWAEFAERLAPYLKDEE